MATKRFCDVCDILLTTIDDQPLIRTISLPESEKLVTASVMITNENNHALTDVCLKCKLNVINLGEAPREVATLQLSPKLYRGPELPTERPPPQASPTFEPSLRPETT